MELLVTGARVSQLLHVPSFIMLHAAAS